MHWIMPRLSGLLAEVLRYDEVTTEHTGSEIASQVTRTWLVLIILLIGLALIGFKKSKRTHLD